MGFFDFFKGQKSNGNEFEISISTNLPISTEVNLWARPDTSTIHVYQRGGIGGQGLLGKFDNKKIAQHIAADKSYIATIESYTKIKIILIDETREESMQRSYLQNNYLLIKEEVKNKIKIKKIEFKISSNSAVVPKEGDIIYPVFYDDIEEHIKDWKFNLSFKDNNDNLIGIKDREPVKTRQILRVHFVNKQKIEFIVQKSINRYDYYEFHILGTIKDS